MSENLLKLQIVDGKTRQAVVDEATDIFGFKAIRIDGVLLDINTVSGLSFATLQAVSSELQTQIEDASNQAFIDLQTVSGALHDEMEAVSGALQTEIDQLSGVIDSILSNNPDQYREVVSEISGKTIFDIPFVFDASNSILDIEVFINGRRYPQCTVGDFSTGFFRKLSDTQVEMNEVIPFNAEFVLWRQGTSSGGGGGGGSTNLDAIDTNPAPSVAAGQSIGTLMKPWSGLYLKDTITSQVYLLQVVSGTFEVTEVP